MFLKSSPLYFEVVGKNLDHRIEIGKIVFVLENPESSFFWVDSVAFYAIYDLL